MPKKAKSESSDSRCPIAASPRLRTAFDERTAAIKGNFPPGIGQPALRALVTAGLTRLEQLSEWTEEQLLELHGMGPNGVRKLRDGLTKKGLKFLKAK